MGEMNGTALEPKDDTDKPAEKPAAAEPPRAGPLGATPPVVLTAEQQQLKMNGYIGPIVACMFRGLFGSVIGNPDQILKGFARTAGEMCGHAISSNMLPQYMRAKKEVLAEFEAGLKSIGNTAPPVQPPANAPKGH